MITDSSIEIDAPAGRVWDVFVDVEHWSTWTASTSAARALDGPGIEVGKRFEIRQPRFPKLVWEVTEVDPGRSWTWRQRSFGAETRATHEVAAQAPNRTLVRERLDEGVEQLPASRLVRPAGHPLGARHGWCRWSPARSGWCRLAPAPRWL